MRTRTPITTSPGSTPTLPTVPPPELGLPKWAWWLVVFAAIALILAAIYRLITPQQVPVPTTSFQNTNLDNSTTSFSGVRYTGPLPAFPSSLSVAQAAPSALTLEDVANALVTRFKLTPEPDVVGMWTNQNYILTVDPDNKRAILSILQIMPSTVVVDPDTSLQTAKDVIATTFPDLQLQPIMEHSVYTNNDVHFEPVSPAQATTIIIPFAFTIDSYPIFYQHESEIPFRVAINGDGQLNRLEFAPQFITYTPAGKKNLISIEDAIKNVNAGQASIITAVQNEVAPIDWTVITSGDLTSVSLEYRMDNDSALIFPFYRFTGLLQTKRGSTLDAQIITPAVDTN